MTAALAVMVFVMPTGEVKPPGPVQPPPANAVPRPPVSPSTPVAKTEATRLPVPLARLTLRTNVRGARVLVDENARAEALADGGLELPIGKHNITVNWGRQRLSKTIELSGGPTELTLNFTNAQIIDTCRRSVCLVRTRYGHGAGFLVEDQQTILTAAHVIDDARTLDEIECIFSPTSPPGPPAKDEARFKVAALVHYSPSRTSRSSA